MYGLGSYGSLEYGGRFRTTHLVAGILNGIGSVSANAIGIFVAQGNLGGIGSILATVTIILPGGQIIMNGVGAVSASILKILLAQADISGIGSVQGTVRDVEQWTLATEGTVEIWN